jgi:hypothetical protein
MGLAGRMLTGKRGDGIEGKNRGGRVLAEKWRGVLTVEREDKGDARQG